MYINLKDKFSQYIDLQQIQYFDEKIKNRDIQLLENNPPDILEQKSKEWLNSIHAFEIYSYLKRLGIHFHGSIMELGSGHGWLTSLLSREKDVNLIYSIDCSEYLIQESSKRMTAYLQGDESKIQRVLGDFHNLDYWSAESMDYIVLDAALHHTRYPDVVLKECSRVLKRKGLCIATRENFHPLFRPDLVKKHYKEAEKTQTIEYLHRKKEIENIAGNQGFKFEYHLLYFPQGVIGNIKKILLRLLNGYFTIWNVVFIFRKS